MIARSANRAPALLLLLDGQPGLTRAPTLVLTGQAGSTRTVRWRLPAPIRGRHG